jgi:hypothetical protein
MEAEKKGERLSYPKQDQSCLLYKKQKAGVTCFLF